MGTTPNERTCHDIFSHRVLMSHQSVLGHPVIDRWSVLLYRVDWRLQLTQKVVQCFSEP